MLGGINLYSMPRRNVFYIDIDSIYRYISEFLVDIKLIVLNFFAENRKPSIADIFGLERQTWGY
jgi:hypothetical protein